jgi:hypothetical protein
MSDRDHWHQCKTCGVVYECGCSRVDFPLFMNYTYHAAEYRTGLNPLLTREETKQYAIEAVTRASLRENFTSKLGRFEYSVGKYSNLILAVIPFDEGEEQTYLLLSFNLVHLILFLA